MNYVKLAKAMGFMLTGHSSNGHTKFVWENDGVSHLVVGPGRHSKIHENDMHRLRQRMHKCKAGKCDHGSH